MVVVVVSGCRRDFRSDFTVTAIIVVIVIIVVVLIAVVNVTHNVSAVLSLTVLLMLLLLLLLYGRRTNGPRPLPSCVREDVRRQTGASKHPLLDALTPRLSRRYQLQRDKKAGR